MSTSLIRGVPYVQGSTFQENQGDSDEESCQGTRSGVHEQDLFKHFSLRVSHQFRRDRPAGAGHAHLHHLIDGRGPRFVSRKERKVRKRFPSGFT